MAHYDTASPSVPVVVIRSIAFFTGIGNTIAMNRKQGHLTADAENDDFSNLEKLYETKRTETLRNLEALSGARRQAFIQLRKVHALFKNLNWKQRSFINSNCVVDNYTPEKIVAISESQPPAEYPGFADVLRAKEYTREPLRQNFSGQLPLKKEAAFLAGNTQSLGPQRPSGIQQKQIKAMRKHILQLGIIQARAEELFMAIVKSAAVFNCQYKTACRELFPLGFISRLWRSLRRFFSHPYFSWQEVGCLQKLGMPACFVLKIVEAPVLGDR